MSSCLSCSKWFPDKKLASAGTVKKFCTFECAMDHKRKKRHALKKAGVPGAMHYYNN